MHFLQDYQLTMTKISVKGTHELCYKHLFNEIRKHNESNSTQNHSKKIYNWNVSHGLMYLLVWRNIVGHYTLTHIRILDASGGVQLTEDLLLLGFHHWRRILELCEEGRQIADTSWRPWVSPSKPQRAESQTLLMSSFLKINTYKWTM